MSRAKPTSVRRKLRAARRKLRVARGRSSGSSSWRRDEATKRSTLGASPLEVPEVRSVPGLAETAHAMATACDAAATGLDLCARRTHDQTIAVAARSAATFVRSLFASVVAVATEKGVDARPRARTCDRLRWEWLASTATVMDGTADRRLLSECARILSEVDVTSALGLGDEVSGRYRLAVAEAHSLAFASEHMRWPLVPSLS